VIEHKAFLKKIKINSAVMGCNNYKTVLNGEKGLIQNETTSDEWSG
jgi:hypothetical protein